MSYLDLSIEQNHINRVRNHGELSPVFFGFETWNQPDKGKLLMGSRKCTMLIGGEPNHGKSQFTNELVMQMIEKHNFKVALFTPESGSPGKVFSHFLGLYQGKSHSLLTPDGRKNQYAMSDAEVAEAEKFLLDKLYVFRQDLKDSTYQSLDNLYNELEKAEWHYGIKFDSMVIDPIYDVDDFEPNAADVLKCLNRINLEAEKNNRFDIVVNHVAETHKHYDPKTGKRKKLIALADEFYGGKNNNRKAMLQVLVNRPEPTVDDYGRFLPEYEDDPYSAIVRPNQTNIHILKVKPEGIAKWGVYDIYYDWKSRRYYERFCDDTDNIKIQFSNSTKFFGRNPEKKNIITQEINDNNGNFTTEELPF